MNTDSDSRTEGTGPRALDLDEVRTLDDLDRLDMRQYAELAGSPASRLDLLKHRLQMHDWSVRIIKDVERAVGGR